MTALDHVVRSAHRRAVWARDPHVCVWCGGRLAYGRATLEHLMPRGLGGPNITANIVLACAGCNGARGTLGITRWACACIADGRSAQVGHLLDRVAAALAEVGAVEEYSRFARYLRDKRRGLVALHRRMAPGRREGLAEFVAAAVAPLAPTDREAAA